MKHLLTGGAGITDGVVEINSGGAEIKNGVAEIKERFTRLLGCY
jgi:hypothetical protein